MAVPVQAPEGTDPSDAATMCATVQTIACYAPSLGHAVPTLISFRAADGSEDVMGLFTLRHGAFAYRLDFALHGAAIVALAAAVLALAPRWQALAWCGAGLSIWSAIEYAIHRFVLHGLDPFRRWHAEHHQHPSDLICAPTVLSAGLIVVLVFLPALALVGRWPASALTLGVMVGYFGYAVTHHALHQWRPRSAWLKRRKQWHSAHHRPGAVPGHFGVTTALWDRVLGSGPVRPPAGSVRNRTDAGSPRK
jgi:cyclopropane-fatty-acyl-phospholipid synthase